MVTVPSLPSDWMTPLICSSAAAHGAQASPANRTDARITADPERLSFMTLSFSLGFHDLLPPVRTNALLARRAPTTGAGQMTANLQIPAKSVRPPARAV